MEKETQLIDFEEFTESHSKDSIWDIENREKTQLIEFIESRILSKVQKLLDEKNNKINLLESKVNRLQEKINDLTEYTSDLEDIVEKWEENGLTGIIKVFPNIHVNINSRMISLDTKELVIRRNGPGGGFDFCWEQIGALYKLEKLDISGMYPVGDRHRIDAKILSRIKNAFVTEFIIEPCDDGFYANIPTVLKNLPELTILSIIDVYNIDKITHALSSCKHNLKKIRLTKCIDRKTEPIEVYCRENNIELALKI